MGRGALVIVGSSGPRPVRTPQGVAISWASS